MRFGLNTLMRCASEDAQPASACALSDFASIIQLCTGIGFGVGCNEFLRHICYIFFVSLALILFKIYAFFVTKVRKNNIFQ